MKHRPGRDLPSSFPSSSFPLPLPSFFLFTDAAAAAARIGGTAPHLRVRSTKHEVLMPGMSQGRYRRPLHSFPLSFFFFLSLRMSRRPNCAKEAAQIDAIEIGRLADGPPPPPLLSPFPPPFPSFFFFVRQRNRAASERREKRASRHLLLLSPSSFFLADDLSLSLPDDCDTLPCSAVMQNVKHERRAGGPASPALFPLSPLPPLLSANPPPSAHR